MREGESGRTDQHPLPRRFADRAERLAWYASAVGLERGARLIAVAVVPLLLPDRSDPRWNTLFAALTVYVLLTALARRDKFLRASDLAVAAALIAASGGNVVPFLMFLVVAVAGPAVQGGVVAGLAAGGTLSAVLLTTLAITDQLPQLGLGGALPAVLLLPLVGVTAASAGLVLAESTTHDRRVLHEANRLLVSLRAIAEQLPGGLDASTVAAGTIAEAHLIEGAGPVVVMAAEDGLLQPAGVAGTRPGQVQGIREDELRGLTGPPPTVRFQTPSSLPTALQRACRDHLHWAVVALGHDDVLAGALLVAFDDLEAGRRARPQLERLASDAAVALENAQLFDGTRERAADAARHRIAGDLHDGVAQSLAHLRMELELLAMASDEPNGGELGRLARVARAALEDLRATISGLRSAKDRDLGTLLARHLDDVRPAHEPELVHDLQATVRLDTARTEDVLRIAQEAVSNALRHAHASTITVTLERTDDGLVLVVEDDGVGLPTDDTEGPRHRRLADRAESSSSDGRGLGLRSMRERAARLGGDLEISHGLSRGTVVVLRCPDERRSARRETPVPS